MADFIRRKLSFGRRRERGRGVISLFYSRVQKWMQIERGGGNAGFLEGGSNMLHEEDNGFRQKVRKKYCHFASCTTC